MDNVEISELMNRHLETRRAFAGVFARDTLPKSTPTDQMPCGYIVNTDKSTNPGQHWIMIWITKPGLPNEYFDSLGELPRYQSFKRLLGPNYKCNRCLIQNPFTSVCGQYAMFFLLSKCKGVSMERIFNYFDKKDLTKNDIFINKFIENTFKTQQPIVDYAFLSERKRLM